MSFIISIFLARLLEPAEFGQVAMVMVFIGIASVFTDVGLGGALIQRRKVLPIHYSSVFYFNVLVGLILSSITYFSAVAIGDFYHSDALVPLAQVMSLSFIINAFSSVQSTKLRKELNYAALTKARFVASLVSGVVGVSLAFNGAGVWSLVAQTLSMGIIYNIFIWSASNWAPAFLFSLKALIQLWGFGFRMFLSGLLEVIFTKLDYLIIGRLFMPATLGFYQRAQSLSFFVVSNSSASLMSVLFPVLSKIQNDLARFQHIVTKALGIISFVAFLLLGVFYLVSEELIVLLFGVKWLPSVHYFKILILSGFAYPISALLVNVLSSRGKSKEFLRLEIYKKMLITINLYVLFTWGIDFFLYGLVVTAVLRVSLNIFFVSREIHVPFFNFVKLVVIQAMVSVSAVLATLYLVNMLGQVGSGILPVAKALSFVSMFLLLNWLFKTYAYRSLAEHIILIVKQRLRDRVKRY